MVLSLLNPFMGRTLLWTRSLQFTAVTNPVLGVATRSFLTSPTLNKEAKPKGVKSEESKPKKAPKKKTNKVGRPAKPKVVVKVLKKDLKTIRPFTPWMDFCAKYIKENKTEGNNMIQFVRDASVAWRALPEAEKQKYGASPEERERAIALNKERRATREYKRAARKFRVKRQMTAPLNSYAMFVKANFESNSTLSFHEQGQRISAKWRALTDEEKSAFKQRCLEELEQSRAATVE